MASVHLNKSTAAHNTGSSVIAFLTCGCLRGRKVAPAAQPLRTVSVDKWPPQAAQVDVAVIEMEQPIAKYASPDKATQEAVKVFKGHFVFKALFNLLPAPAKLKFEQDAAIFFEATKQKKENWGACYNALAMAVQQAMTIARKDHKDLATYFRIALLNDFVSSPLTRHDYMTTIISNNVVVNFADTCADLLRPVPENADGVRYLKTMVAGFEEAAKGLKNFNRELAKKEQLERADASIETFIKNCSALTTLLDRLVDDAALPKQVTQATESAKKPKVSRQERYNRESAVLLARLNK